LCHGTARSTNADLGGYDFGKSGVELVDHDQRINRPQRLPLSDSLRRDDLAHRGDNRISGEEILSRFQNRVHHRESHAPHLLLWIPIDDRPEVVPEGVALGAACRASWR
jgi:hypothetical protein